MVDLRAVLHEEAVHTRELVGLRWEHHDVELDVGEVGTGQVETTPDILSGTRSLRASIDSESSSVFRGAS